TGKRRIIRSPARLASRLDPGQRHTAALRLKFSQRHRKGSTSMQAIRSILVVIQPDLPDQLALKRARLIASVTQSHLLLLACAEASEDQGPLLAELSEQLRAEGFSVSTEQAWLESPHQTVIAAQQSEGCSLVIKQHRRDSILKKAFLTPEDWKLLRYCPCPVLMVKSDAPWSGRNIFAAVDVGNSDREHQTLHAGIVGHAHDIARLCQGQLHVLSAHPSPMLTAADPTFQLKESIEQRYREACRKFQEEFEIEDRYLHIEEGPADVQVAILDLEFVDRKSTRLNSSHVKISYAVFCWKKEKKNI